MTPARVALGLIVAVAYAAARHAWALLLAIAASVAMLTGCAPPPPMDFTPVQPAPVSALRMYEAGRQDALADLRQAIGPREPLPGCPDKVSWVKPEAEAPTWGSREESIRIYEQCRQRDARKAAVIRRMRNAIRTAE